MRASTRSCVRRRERACAHTTFTGSPLMRAARSQSACSGARLTTLPSSFPTFIRTGSPPTSTVKLSRSQLDPVEVGDPHAERARLAQHRLGDRALVAAAAPARRGRSRGGRASSASGVGPDVERAGLEAGLRRRRARARGAGRRGWPRSARRRRCCGVAAEDHADDVRAAPRGRACRRRSPSLRASSSGSGRSASASEATSAAPVGVTSSIGDVDAVDRRALEQAQRRRRGQRQPAVGGVRRSRGRSAAASRSPCRRPSDSSASATPTTSPIASTAPTSWKCTCSGVDPVDAALGDRELLERASARAARARSGRSAASICVADRGPVPVRLRRRADHVDGRRARSRAARPCRARCRRPSTPSPCEVDGRAGVDQRAEQHVARDAADAVDVGITRGLRGGARRCRARSAPRSCPRRSRRRCSRPRRPRRTRSSSPAAR